MYSGGGVVMEGGELGLGTSAGGFVPGTCWWERGWGLVRCSDKHMLEAGGGEGMSRGSVLPAGLVPVVKEEKSLVLPCARDV